MALFIILSFAVLSFIAGVIGFSGTAGKLARLSKIFFLASFVLLVLAFVTFLGLDKFLQG